MALWYVTSRAKHEMLIFSWSDAHMTIPNTRNSLLLATQFLLQVLEACVRNCGARFHQEIGKFRFLNEIIKVISPKVGVRCEIIRVFLPHVVSYFT